MGSYQDLPIVIPDEAIEPELEKEQEQDQDVDEEMVDQSSDEDAESEDEPGTVLKRPTDLSLADYSVVTRLADIGYYFYCLDEADEDLQTTGPLHSHVRTLAKMSEPKKLGMAAKVGRSHIKSSAAVLKATKQFWTNVYSKYAQGNLESTDLAEIFKRGFVDEDIAPMKVLDSLSVTDSKNKSAMFLDTFVIPRIVYQMLDEIVPPEDGELPYITFDSLDEETNRLETIKSQVSVFSSKWESVKMSVLHGARLGDSKSTKAAVLEQLHQGLLSGTWYITSLSSKIEERIKLGQLAITNWKKIRDAIKSDFKKSSYIKFLTEVCKYAHHFWDAWSYSVRKINNGCPMDVPPNAEFAEYILQQTLDRLCFPPTDAATSTPSRWSLDRTSNLGWIDHWSYIMRARQSFSIKETERVKVMATLMPDDSLYALTDDQTVGEKWTIVSSMLNAGDTSEIEARHYTVPRVKKWIKIGPSINPACLLPFAVQTSRLTNESEWAEGSAKYGFEVYSSRYWVPLSTILSAQQRGSSDYTFSKAVSYCALNGLFAHGLCTLFAHLRKSRLRFSHILHACNSIEVNPKGKLRIAYLSYLEPSNDDGKELALTFSQLLASCFMVIKNNERVGIVTWEWIQEQSMTDTFLYLLLQPKMNPHWNFETWIRMVSITVLSPEGLQKSIGLSDAPKITGASSQINVLGPQLMRVYDVLEERRQGMERTMRYSRNDGIFAGILRYYINAEDSGEFDDKPGLIKRLRAIENRRIDNNGNVRRIVVSASTRRLTRTASVTAATTPTSDNVTNANENTNWVPLPETPTRNNRDQMEMDEDEESTDGLDFHDCYVNIVPSFAFEGESGSGIGVTSEVLSFFWEVVLSKHKFFARSVSTDSEPYYYIKDCTDAEGEDIECPGCGDGKRCVMFDVAKCVARIWAHTFLTLQEDYNRLLPFSLATLVLKILLLPSCILALDLDSDQKSRVLSLLLNEDDLREVDPEFWNRIRFMTNMSHSELATYMEDEDSSVVYGRWKESLECIPAVGTPKLRPEDLEEHRYSTIESKFFSGPRADYYFSLARHWQLLMRDFIDVNALHSDSLRYYLSSKPSIDISQMTNRVTFTLGDGVGMSKAVMEEYAQQFREWIKTLDQMQMRGLLKYWTGQALIPQHSTLLVEFVKSQAEIQAATCYASLRISINGFAKAEEFGEWCREVLEKIVIKDATYFKYNTL